VGVLGGAEAAVQAMRRLVKKLPSDHVIVKLDLSKCLQLHQACNIYRDCPRGVPRGGQNVELSLRSHASTRKTGEGNDIPA